MYFSYVYFDKYLFLFVQIDDEEEEYDDDEAAPYKEVLDEEDPKVIKELIDLIKKLGGIEQLEKQLNFDNVKSSESTPTVAPLISKKLYEKVLNSATGRSFLPQSRYSFSTQRNNTATASTSDNEKPKSTSGVNKYSSVIRNNKPSSQSDIADKKQSDSSGRPQYVTINRQSNPANKRVQSTSEVEDDDVDDDVDNEPVISKVTTGFRATTVQPQYVNIQRRKPASTTSSAEHDASNEEDGGETSTRKQYNFLERKRNPVQQETDDEKPAVGGIR